MAVRSPTVRYHHFVIHSQSAIKCWVFQCLNCRGQNVDPKTAAKEQQSKQYEWIRYSLRSHLFDSFAMRKFNKCLNLGWTCMQIIGCTGMFSATLLGHGICSRVCQSRCVCFNYPHRVKIVQTFKKPSFSNWVWNDGNIYRSPYD